MIAAPGTVFLRPRWKSVASIVIGLPLALILLSILGIVVLDLLGVDLGIRFARSTARPAPPKLGVALWMGFMALATLYGILSIFLLTFARFAYGQIHDPAGIQLRSLIGRWRTVRLADITGYSDRSFPRWTTGGSCRSGIALYLADGSHIQLLDLHVHGIDELAAVLNQQGIRYLGAGTCWTFPFMKRKFKFDPR